MPDPDPTKDQDPTQPELTDELLEKASGGGCRRCRNYWE